jgi:molybdate transport system regulatory protein
MSMKDEPVLRLRVKLSPDFAMGPGKADILDGIARTGSISAAGRALGMSYRRAWSLVEAMNAAFAAPVVETSRGGAEGGGARLSETGEAVLALYRRMQEEAVAATVESRAEMAAMLGDVSGET